MTVALLQVSHPVDAQSKQAPQWKDSVAVAGVQDFVDEEINGDCLIRLTGYYKRDSTVLDSVLFDSRKNELHVFLNERLAYAPVRENTITELVNRLRLYLPAEVRESEIFFYAGDNQLKEYIPNYFRSNSKAEDDKRKIKKYKRTTPPLARNESKPYDPQRALYNINIALWHSHGWYYEQSLHRWEWQRARLFQTVEDLYPMAYTLTFLVPMLENAGATVLLPRERDWQVNEVVVDNDESHTGSIYLETPAVEQISSANTGFGLGTPPYIDENPFQSGTYAEFMSDKKGNQKIEWIPDIPEDGYYWVYISYHSSDDNVDDAHYNVYHAGGQTKFIVNQQIGGSTWIHLGRFKFTKGVNPQQGKVVLSDESKKSKHRITADAVRFGGGMGNISRNGLVSKRPRYQEAARYYLQYAGFPDTLTWNFDADSVLDYVDDYQSRGEWVNYLSGAPVGPNNNGNIRGSGIPVDLSLAFHTDAGITDNDTVIGTLGIYSTKREDKVFSSGLSKMASRDLCDIIQTQIVNDIRNKYDPAWTRRGMWDRPYSEAYRPEVPAMLLELYSHQNFLDIRFGAEPGFRFDVSRAIYKGMLKFLNSLYGIDYIVQPLPVTHLRTSFDSGGGAVLSWSPRTDPLEPTAEPEEYIVYTRMNDSGFDNGKLVRGTFLKIDSIYPDSIYSFKVTALNRGGESFPSEVLSLCRTEKAENTVLIVNAFDRTGGPAYFNDTKQAGFLDMIDQGVPYMYDMHTTGSQYDFDKSSPWIDDDSPGHGASYADLETIVIPGNTFDFTCVHGKAIRNAGYSFVSVSDEILEENAINLSQYAVIDFLAGEEKTCFMPKNDTVPHFQLLTGSMLRVLSGYLNQGGSLFISGAHIASDMHFNEQDSLAGSVLKYKWRTGNASRLGDFYFMDTAFSHPDVQFSFNAGVNPHIYTVEGADALEPADPEATTIVRYSENNMSAGIAYQEGYRLIAFGFPFETILEESDRDLLMKRVLTFLINE